MNRPYADAARAYWSAGWANPIPVERKWPPPKGYTGYDGKNVSWPDIQAWLDGEEGDHNIALRLPDDIIGIDVDAHDGKSGEMSLAAAEAALGPLPPTARSTSRASFGASGIRFYRVPPGANLRGAEKRFRARFGDHVDIIRRDHRYAVVWPSVHPDTGNTYTWYDENVATREIPKPVDLVTLPEAWVTFLTAPADQEQRLESHAEPRSSEAGTSPWDLPRQFTREQATEFVRPHFEALRAAPTGTINNRLNEAAVVLSHFVPVFWSAAEATRFLLDALGGTAYDGRTWRAESTITSGLGARTWRAEMTKEPTSSDLVPSIRRGEFTGIRDRKRAEPEFIRRMDGRALLYPGKDSYLYAETESGKSWLVAMAVTQCINDDVPVMVVDFEEGDELEYGNRLLDLGMTEEKLNNSAKFRYLMVDGRCTDELMIEADDMGAQMIVYEGMSVAYDVYGLAVKENDSATAFRRWLVKPHLIAGRAVLTTDHVVKDRDSRGRYAIGGVMKLNAASGGAFLLVNVEGLAPGQRGASNLYVTKDRPGGVKRHCVPAGEKFDPQVKRFGTLIVDDSHNFVSYLDVSIMAPRVEDAVSAESALTNAVLAAIKKIRGQGLEPSMNKIRAECNGDGETETKGFRVTAVDAELERLAIAGRLLESHGGHGARVFDLVRGVDDDEEK